jgi:hypothetical protein
MARDEGAYRVDRPALLTHWGVCHQGVRLDVSFAVARVQLAGLTRDGGW